MHALKAVARLITGFESRSFVLPYFLPQLLLRLLRKYFACNAKPERSIFEAK